MSNLRTIMTLFRANKHLMGEARELPLGIVLTFLGVALWGEEVKPDGEPFSLEDLAVRIGFSPTTISQHLRYLSYHYRIGKPGLGLIETGENPFNRRKKFAVLTPKGKGLVRHLDLIIRRGLDA